MNDRRGVVLRVHTVKNRVADDAFAQIAVAVSLADALGHGFLKITVHADLVAVLDKQHRHAGVLAERDPLLGGDRVVFDDLVEHTSADRGGLLLPRVFQRGKDVAADIIIAVQKKLLDRRSDRPGGNRPVFHCIILSSFLSIIKYFSDYFNTQKNMI